MNAEEFLKLLLSGKDGYIDWDTEYTDSLSGEYYTHDGALVDVKVVDASFHREGNWHSDLYVVLSVGDQYFKKSGYYQSHDGEYWDGAIVEVEPQQKTVTQWNDSSTPYYHSDDYDSYDSY